MTSKPKKKPVESTEEGGTWTAAELEAKKEAELWPDFMQLLADTLFAHDPVRFDAFFEEYVLTHWYDNSPEDPPDLDDEDNLRARGEKLHAGIDDYFSVLPVMKPKA